MVFLARLSGRFTASIVSLRKCTMKRDAELKVLFVVMSLDLFVSIAVLINIMNTKGSLAFICDTFNR